MKLTKWVTIISGALLFLAPFVFGYSGTPVALWTSVIMGVLMVVLGFLGSVLSYKWAAGAGVVTFVAPLVLGFSGISTALWSCLILGGLVILLAGYYGFFSAEAKSGRVQERHA